MLQFKCFAVDNIASYIESRGKNDVKSLLKLQLTSFSLNMKSIYSAIQIHTSLWVFKHYSRSYKMVS